MLDLLVPAADGCLLSTQVALPNQEGGSYPVLAVRTPYGKEPYRLAAEGWTKRGYAFVAQDVRGRYASQGLWEPYRHEGADGRSLVDWIAMQPWCNGRIALEGASYGAYCAMTAASRSDSGTVHAIVSLVPALGLKRTSFHPGGAFRLSDRCWWTAVHGSGGPVHLQQEYDKHMHAVEKAITGLPVSQIDQHMPMPLRSWGNIVEGSYAEEQEPDIGSHDIPTLHIGGWHDPFITETIRCYELQSRCTASSQALLIGPWRHEVNARPYFRSRSYGDNAIIPLGKLQHAWLCHILNGVPYPYPPVLVYALTANVWTAPPAWPPPGLSERRLLFVRSSSGNLQLVPTDSHTEPAGAEPRSTSYCYNPSQPAPSRELPMPRNDLDERPDTLSFTSDPLDESLLLAGAPRIVVTFSSSAPSTHVFATLSEVMPDGTSIYVSHGMATVEGTAGQPITPRSVPIELLPLVQQFPKGNRLRISITSSSFPRYARHLNTANDPLTSTEWETAVQTVWHSTSEHSYASLPVHNDMIERWLYEFPTSARTAHR